MISSFCDVQNEAMAVGQNTTVWWKPTGLLLFKEQEVMCFYVFSSFPSGRTGIKIKKCSWEAKRGIFEYKHAESPEGWNGNSQGDSSPGPVFEPFTCVCVCVCVMSCKTCLFAGFHAGGMRKTAWGGKLSHFWKTVARKSENN